MRPSSNEHTQSTQRPETAFLYEQVMLMTSQSASVHERRRTLRERQRAHLTMLIIPSQSERDSEEDGRCLSRGSSEEPRSRFSHSSTPSPVVTPPPMLPAPRPSPSPRKRKSILAKLVKAFAS